MHNGSPAFEPTVTDPDLRAWVLEQRATVLPSGPYAKQSIAYDVKVRPEAYLSSMLKVCDSLSLAGKKMFHTLPQRVSDVPCHVTIDTDALVDLLGNRGGSGLLTWEKKQQIWEKFFKVRGRQFRRGNSKAPRYVFKGAIATDGMSASVVLVRTDLRDQKRVNKEGTLEQTGDNGIAYLSAMPAVQLRKLQGTSIPTIDPGCRDIVYVKASEQGPKMRYTAPMRRKHMKVKRYNAIRKGVHAEAGVVAGKTVLQWNDCLSAHSSRTTDVERYKDWIRVKSYVTMLTSKHWSKPVFARLRFNAKVNKRRSEDVFVTKFGEMFGKPETTKHIAIGDWSKTTCHLKNSAPTPQKGLHAMFRRHGYNTWLIGEQYTSKRCSVCCSGDCCTFKERLGKKGATQPVHGLLKCQNTQCGAIHNRNGNAVNNQLRVVEAILAGQERPNYLSVDMSHVLNGTCITLQHPHVCDRPSGVSQTDCY
jgi:hypothetical protein